ncbi:hypothetical protein, partial [Chamaesiphon sp. OTE_20_metabat_361]|uniref:hypothetical protein n=1 Tax=Chamaesiphon sp. OTE_20_metabat_361 TaxID=2964689 RepID=UPI00286CD66A
MGVSWCHAASDRDLSDRDESSVTNFYSKLMLLILNKCASIFESLSNLAIAKLMRSKPTPANCSSQLHPDGREIQTSQSSNTSLSLMSAVDRPI